MTHLYRIFVRRASVPICFSNIFPGSSTICVSHYNSLVSGNHLIKNSAVSKPGIMRLMPTYNQRNAEGSMNVDIQKAVHDIQQWKEKGVGPKDLCGINTIGGVMIMPQSYGWVSFDLSGKRILDYGGKLFPLMFIESQKTTSEFDIIAREIKECIPDCDLYVMEIPKYYPKRKKMSDIENMLTSKLVALLNPECDSPENLPGKVILQDKAEINSFFRLWVRNERVSAYQKIQRLAGDLYAHGVMSKEIAVNFLPTDRVKLSSKFLMSEENDCELVYETISLAFLLVFSYLGRNGRTEFIVNCGVDGKKV